MDAIYLDNNATTPLLPAVAEAMRPHQTAFGNPASAHAFGRRARQALEDARERTAALVDAHADEMIFASGATEANNLALFGLAGEPPGQLLGCAIEHPSVVEPLLQLKRRGFRYDELSVDGTGEINRDRLVSRLHPDTRIVAAQLANQETGTIQPVAMIAGRLPESTLLHCDAAQAVGRIAVSFHDLGVTTLTFSAHKFHGPPGIGALLLRRGVRLQPQLWGGHQQQERRPGTEAVALAVGLAAALELAQREAAQRRDHILRLRQCFLKKLRAEAAPVVLNGPEEGGIPHTLNLSFPGCRAEVLLMNLDLAGVACSTGSACASGSLRPSPVLEAMGVSDDALHSAMRFSLNAFLSEAEVVEAAARIVGVVHRLRQRGAQEP